MVIDNLHFVGFAVAPHEADPPLLIDPNAVLPCSVASKLLKLVPWEHREMIQPTGSIQHLQFSQRTVMDLIR